MFFCDADSERVQTAEAELGALGPARGMIVDVTDGEAVRVFMEKAASWRNSLDVLVNNAGIATFEPFLAISEISWNRTLSVNLTGSFLCAQAAARIMVEGGTPGSIVNMASTNGLLGEAGLAHYNASKAGVVLLTKTMAIELAPYKIRVNSVCPGMIKTELAKEGGADMDELAAYTDKIPLGRYGHTDEVANAFAFLASDEASFITGTELVVDGGQICQE